ncbi:MAG: protein translocase subunit SecF [Acidobacteriota bacterium]|nr:MAG: protein translocase subunit SecF [Acidobacteriota bacterium]
MDIVKNPNIDWLGKKWIFICVSSLLAVLSLFSLLAMKGLNLGVDFTGGTLVYVKFNATPDLESVRGALSQAGLNAEGVTRFDEPEANEVQIRMARVESEEAEDLSLESGRVFEALFNAYDQGKVQGEKADLNNLSAARLGTLLGELDPEGKRSELGISEHSEYYDGVGEQIVDARNERSGLFGDFSELDGLNLPAAVVQSVKDATYLGSFTIISVESVGPKVGRELRERAQSAVLFSLLGMLIYIAFRFRPIYGLAAIIALFHDVFLTLGLFSITGKELSLTVIAALLTLVGYSINDTIVVFDRVRENLKLMRRADMISIFNASINQTLNRTIMTSGMTFLAVFALYIWGGDALNGFSFALVAGIIVGTYSSVAIASPIVLWWENFSEQRKARARG